MKGIRNRGGLAILASTAWALAAGSAAGQSLELSADVDFTLAGSLVEDHEFFDLATGAGAVGLVPVGIEVDAYHRYPNGDQLYSTKDSFSLAAGGLAERADVVRFDGVVETLAFDASNEGIGLGVNTDAVAVDDGGNLLLSFDTGHSLSGLDVRDEDLVLFDGSGFSLFFDGSSQSVPETLDLDAAELRESDGHLLLSFDASGEIGGVFFEDEDLLDFDPGSGAWSLALDGSAEAAALAATDLIAVAVPEPAAVSAIWAGTLGLVGAARWRRQLPA